MVCLNMMMAFEAVENVGDEAPSEQSMEWSLYPIGHSENHRFPLSVADGESR
jgi:hypothetical protein